MINRIMEILTILLILAMLFAAIYAPKWWPLLSADFAL